MTDYPFPKASIQHRLGQLLLEYALFIVTLGIGYLIWFLIIFIDRQDTILSFTNKSANKYSEYSEYTE